MAMTPERIVEVLAARRDSLELQVARRAARKQPTQRDEEELEALSAAIEALSDSTALEVQRTARPPHRRRERTSSSSLARMKRFAVARHRRESAPKMTPQLVPATKRHEPLIRSLWNIPLGEAMALLPVSNNGKHGKARRYYFVVRTVERFLDSLPTV